MSRIKLIPCHAGTFSKAEKTTLDMSLPIICRSTSSKYPQLGDRWQSDEFRLLVLVASLVAEQASPQRLLGTYEQLPSPHQTITLLL